MLLNSLENMYQRFGSSLNITWAPMFIYFYLYLSKEKSFRSPVASKSGIWWLTVGGWQIWKKQIHGISVCGIFALFSFSLSSSTRNIQASTYNKLKSHHPRGFSTITRVSSLRGNVAHKRVKSVLTVCPTPCSVLSSICGKVG